MCVTVCWAVCTLFGHLTDSYARSVCVAWKKMADCRVCICVHVTQWQASTVDLSIKLSKSRGYCVHVKRVHMYVRTHTTIMSCVVCVAPGSLCNAPMSCPVPLTSDVSTKTTLSSLSHLTWQILRKQVWSCGILYTALEDVLECDSTCTCVGHLPHPSPAVRVCVCVRS